MTFSCFAPAHPERVWDALTDAALTGRYLYGLELHSQWQPGSPIEARATDDRTVFVGGEVLCRHTGTRLSYLLRSSAADPPVYVTWLLRSAPGGSVVTLQIDDLDAAACPIDTEDVWLPVLAGLAATAATAV
ncbi:MAG TPA: SRPBCC domain-containing protein [Jatrophihabitans sp.]|uniref:SRPBCC domain-containing protein n=1 Tax=Jatrophihabitans sp. TaxID=1932789 RepID=UPI002DFFA7F6|nr:SRPBCC domain-containing protein [Jatrophihabitans sp.]